MSWLRNTSLSFARQLSRSLDPKRDYEPHACYTSFCKHCQQVVEIIDRSQPHHLHDDVLAVVNHVEQLSSLVSLEARAVPTDGGSCMRHLLAENLLHHLHSWTSRVGKYENAVRLELLKLYGTLISHFGSEVIATEPFLRPLLKLFSEFRNDLPPPNLEEQLVTVLNQLCVSLMQNMRFIDLFFLTNHTETGSYAEFIILRLLLPSVHREGSIGSAARDAMLLCANMSARCTQLAECALKGNTCPVLATGLSGLYSLLPRTLGDKMYRLTPDDVNHVHKLTLFIDSLEFCNATAQVAHPSVKKHLLDLLFQGFLVPVLGPALLQTKPDDLQSGASEQATAMTYLELILRCVTQKGLLRTVLEFMFNYEYDGVKVIDVMLRRLDGNSQLSLVSLSLMETLIDLNIEDVMIELVYKYLITGNHLLPAFRSQICLPEHYRKAATEFLSLAPECCQRPLFKTKEWVDEMSSNGRKLLDIKREDLGRRINGTQENIAMDNLVRTMHNYGNPNDSLIGNYHAYLCDSRFEIVSKTIACSNWHSQYNKITTKRETNNNTKESKEDAQNNKEMDSLVSICTSGYETLKTSDTSEKEPHSLTSLNDESAIDSENIVNSLMKGVANENQCESKDLDSINSFGDGSCYDSFKYKIDDNEDEGFAEEGFIKNIVKVDEVREFDEEVPPPVRSWRVSPESIVGPLLSNLLRKATSLLEYEIVVNFRVSSVIRKLASFPTPILTSLLLCPDFSLHPNVPSLYQILSRLKEELDELTSTIDNIDQLVDQARVYLVQREMALVKSRIHSHDEGQSQQELTPQKQEDPFKRGESKRRSLSMLGMFGRKLSTSSSPNTSMTYSSSPLKPLNFTQETYWNQSITLRSILNAVILNEWLKELASLCEEHALRLSADNYEDDTYIRNVSL